MVSFPKALMPPNCEFGRTFAFIIQYQKIRIFSNESKRIYSFDFQTNKFEFFYSLRTLLTTTTTQGEKHIRDVRI